VSAVSGSGGSRWVSWAAAVTAAFPLAGSDWEAHTVSVDAGIYDVRNRRYLDPPAADPVQIFAEEPPPTPEEEEALTTLF
jgi:hypothetical protein